MTDLFLYSNYTHFQSKNATNIPEHMCALRWVWIIIRRSRDYVYGIWHYNVFCVERALCERKTNWTRRSENDNAPQPLDQWTNSSFIGQQVGNCKSFTLTHYFADLSAMHHGRRSIPLCIQHHIQLTSLSFQVSQTSHCWVTAISIFYLENPRSRSWVRSKFEVTMWV